MTRFFSVLQINFLSGLSNWLIAITICIVTQFCSQGSTVNSNKHFNEIFVNVIIVLIIFFRRNSWNVFGCWVIDVITSWALSKWQTFFQLWSEPLSMLIYCARWNKTRWNSTPFSHGNHLIGPYCHRRKLARLFGPDLAKQHCKRRKEPVNTIYLTTFWIFSQHDKHNSFNISTLINDSP